MLKEEIDAHQIIYHALKQFKSDRADQIQLK